MASILKNSTSILALAFTILAAGTAARAQTAPEDVESVTVSGIRKSIEDSIDTKRQSAVIMDSISAEDIGKLPDQNVAETLSRIPGVQITRMEGQGTAVSVRGINLNKVELNGQNFVGSAADGAPKLADIAPELLASVEVIKSPSADQAEGWLGAIINLKTKRPLDFSEPVYAGRVSGVYADRVDAGGGKVSALAAHQFLDDTLGALLSVSFSDEPGRSDQYSSGGWAKLATDINGDGVADTITMPLRLQQFVDVYRDKNLALNGSLQWRPNSDWNINFDGLYTRFDARRLLTGAQSILTAAITNGTVLSDGTLASGTYSGVTYRPITYNEDSWSSTNALSLTADYTHGPLQMHFSASQSQGNGLGRDGLTTDASSTGNAQVLVARQIAGQDTVGVKYALGKNNISPNYSLITNFNTLDPANYEIYASFDATYPISNRGRDMSADARYELNWWFLKAIKAGARVENVNIYSAQRMATYPPFNTYDPTPANSLRVTEVPGLNYGNTITDFLGGIGGDFPRTLLSAFPEPSVFRAFLHATGPDLSSLSSLGSVAQVHQQTNATYVKTELGGDIFGLPFDGDAGLRWVDTHRNAFGYTIVGGASAVPTTVVKHFDLLLPSANLVLHPSDHFDVRLDAAKVTARPPLNLTSVATSLALVSGTGAAGNPNLKPFVATQYDISAEWYIDAASMVSVAAFTKDVSAFTRIVQVTENHPEAPNNTNGSTVYLVNRPVNGDHGTIAGYEINYQHALSFLPEPFDGLGYQLTYTHSDSRTPNVDEFTGKILPMPYASKHSANAVLYYEKYGFSARLAYNYRSAFLVAQQGAASGGSLFGDGRGQYDISASYDLTDQYKITFEGVNIGKNINSFYVGNKNRIYNAFMDDTRFYVGLAATF
jgi:TonB-dependent receptor